MLLIIAIVTLAVGITLLVILFQIPPEEISQENQSNNQQYNIITDKDKLQDLKNRFIKGSYILTTVALIEMIIIFRLFK